MHLEVWQEKAEPVPLPAALPPVSVPICLLYPTYTESNSVPPVSPNVWHSQQVDSLPDARTVKLFNCDGAEKSSHANIFFLPLHDTWKLVDVTCYF